MSAVSLGDPMSQGDAPHQTHSWTDNDASLVARVRTGDADALRVLYLRVYPALLDFACRYVRETEIAEEVVHDVFLSLWTAHQTWSPTFGINAYLFGAVRNRALNVGRAASVRAHIAPEIAQRVSVPLPADTFLLSQERESAVRAAVAQLPERTREAVTLRWMHGLSHAAVASVLGVSEDAARKLVTRAADQLRKLLRDYAG